MGLWGNRGNNRLVHAIESTRSEMIACFCRAGCCFDDTEVVKLSRKLDRLLNLYYRRQNKKEK